MDEDIMVIDNFLPSIEFRRLKNKLISHEFPWFFFNLVDSVEDISNPSKFQFQHHFYEHCRWKSSFHPNIFEDVEIKLQPKSWLRIKANLQVRDPEAEFNTFHVDVEGCNTPYRTGILYLNTCNGQTKFEGGTVVDSVENRFISFPGHFRHTGKASTDVRRIVLNFCWFE